MGDIVNSWTMRNKAGDKEFRLSVSYDTDFGDSPLEWTSDFRIASWDDRLDFGSNAQPIDAPEDMDELCSIMADMGVPAANVRPISIYEHSRYSIKLADTAGWPHTCPWDTRVTAAIGFLAGKGPTDQEAATKELSGHLDAYTDYCNGNVYCLQLDERTVAVVDGDELTGAWDLVDSCGGYYGVDTDDAAALAVELCGDDTPQGDWE